MNTYDDLPETIRIALAYLERVAIRYDWLREHPAWETEAFLGGLTPEQFDAAVDKAMAESHG